jgi:hypothetical protein
MGGTKNKKGKAPKRRSVTKKDESPQTYNSQPLSKQSDVKASATEVSETQNIQSNTSMSCMGADKRQELRQERKSIVQGTDGDSNVSDRPTSAEVDFSSKASPRLEVEDDGDYWKESEVKKFIAARRVKLGDTAALPTFPLASYRILTRTEASAFKNVNMGDSDESDRDKTVLVAKVSQKMTCSKTALPTAKAHPVDSWSHANQPSINVSLINVNVSVRGSPPTGSTGSSTYTTILDELLNWFRCLADQSFEALSGRASSLVTAICAAIAWLLFTVPFMLLEALVTRVQVCYQSMESKVSGRLERISGKVRDEITSKLYGYGRRHGGGGGGGGGEEEKECASKQR